jgi:hypothetical protein
MSKQFNPSTKGCKFKMQNRPRKPSAPAHTEYDVGNYVSLTYFLECVDAFKTANPKVNPGCIMVETEHDDYSGTRISLQAPPESYASYEQAIKDYKVELKAYTMWQKKFKPQIAKAKAAKKKATAKRKLERTMERLNKELEAVEGKLAAS